MSEARKSQVGLLAFAKRNALKHFLMESTSAGFKHPKILELSISMSPSSLPKAAFHFCLCSLKRKPSGQIHHQKRPNTQFQTYTEVPLIRITAHEIYPLKP